MPVKPIDFGESPEADQVLISQFLPPNPANICASLFGRSIATAGGRDEHHARIGNRLRNLREALTDAVNKVRSETEGLPTGGRIKVTLVEGSAAIKLDGDDIAGDCFHLSAHGHESLARIVLPEVLGR